MALFVFLFTAQSACGQQKFADSLNTEQFWMQIVFIDSNQINDAIVGADTLVTIVSNRAITQKNIRFISEERDTTGALHYYTAYINNNTRYVWHRKNFEDVLLTMPGGKDLVIYTEGYGKVFTTGMFRALQMQAQHKVNIVYLDYPSLNHKLKKLGNWKFVHHNACIAGKDFQPILKAVKEYNIRHNFPHVTLFYHSMGNLALQTMITNELFHTINYIAWVDNLVLNAPCVPTKHHKEWLSKIDFAKRIYVHYNPHDKTLGGAMLVSGNRKLGHRAKNLLERNNVSYINFENYCGFNHSYFISLPDHAPIPEKVKTYMYGVLHGNSINVHDTAIFEKSHYHTRGYELR